MWSEEDLVQYCYFLDIKSLSPLRVFISSGSDTDSDIEDTKEVSLT